MHLHIPDMHCGGCVASITRILVDLDPAATVQAELEERTARISTSASLQTVLAALLEAGFPAMEVP